MLPIDWTLNLKKNKMEDSCRGKIQSLSLLRKLIFWNLVGTFASRCTTPSLWLIVAISAGHNGPSCPWPDYSFSGSHFVIYKRCKKTETLKITLLPGGVTILKKISEYAKLYNLSTYISMGLTSKPKKPLLIENCIILAFLPQIYTIFFSTKPSII